MTKFRLAHVFSANLFIMAMSFLLFLYPVFVTVSSASYDSHGGPGPVWNFAGPDSCLATLYIDPSAQITTMNYRTNQDTGSNEPNPQYLRFKLLIKNISDSPRSYKLTLLVLGGPTVESFCPDIKEAPMSPGEESLCLIPVNFPKRPDGVVLTVESIPTGFLEICAKAFRHAIRGIKQWLIPENIKGHQAMPQRIRIYCQQ